MSASDTHFPCCPASTKRALVSKNKAWIEVEKNADKIAKDALARKTKAAAFQPTFTDTSACNELIRGVALDYEKVGLLRLIANSSDKLRPEYR